MATQPGGADPESLEGTGYSLFYEGETLTPSDAGCGDVVWLDLDVPRVVRGENLDETTDLSFDLCPGEATLSGHDKSISLPEAVSAQECVQTLRREPVEEVTQLEEGMVVCVQTERGRIAALEITNIPDEETIEVSVTAWEPG